MKDGNELRSALDQQIGTEHYFYNPLYPKMKYTDGVKCFCDNAGNGAYWLLDIIGTEYFPKQNPKEPFMHIRLVVKDGAAEILVDDGNGNALALPRDIVLTDCPEGAWDFYLEGDVLLLPSEH